MDKTTSRRERLQALIQEDFHDNVAEFVRRVNEHPSRRERPLQASYIHRIFSRDAKHRKNIGEDLAREFEHAAGKPEGWLDQGSRAEQTLAKYVVLPGGGIPSTDDFVELPVMTVRGSCGGGRFNGDEPKIKRLAFQREWVKSKGVNPDDALFVDADGDSMAPHITDRDIVLFNTRKTVPRSGEIYAIEHPDGTKIKRLFIEADRSIVLRSDNLDKRQYPDERVAPEHVDQIRVLGEFVWRGGG